MSISLSSNFLLTATLPLDARTVAATLVARDAIPAGQRFLGLTVFVVADTNTYQLQTGITNSDWVLVLGSGTSITGSGAAGRLAYWTSASALSSLSTLTVHTTSNILLSSAGFSTAASPVTTIRYVDSVNGNDANSGLSPGVGNAWLTINHALQQQPQVANGEYQINLAAGTYGAVFFKDILGNAANTIYGNNIVRIIGDIVTPANVIIQDGTNPVNIMNGRSVLILDGVTLDGSGTSNGGILCFNGVFDLINVAVQNCIIGIQMNEASRGRWISSSAGGTVSASTTGITLSRGSSFSLQRSISITGFSGSGISVSANALFGMANTVTTLTLTGEVGSGAASGISVSSGGVVSSSTTTFNISNIRLSANGNPFDVSSGGKILLGSNAATINLTNCTRGGRILSGGTYVDGTGAGNAYNYTTTTAEWLIDSDSLLYAPGSFNSAVIKSGNQAGYVLGTMWRKQGTTAVNFTLNSQSHSIKCNPAAPIVGIVPLAADMGIGRVFVISDISGSAATNTITLQASGGDLINGQSTFVLDINWGDVTLEAITGGWSAT